VRPHQVSSVDGRLHFADATHWDGSRMGAPFERMLEAADAARDPLVQLTLLRAAGVLSQNRHNADCFVDAGLFALLSGVIGRALGALDAAAHNFPTLKCAFLATEVRTRARARARNLPRCARRACPLSTGDGTRLVRLVRGRGGGGGVRPSRREHVRQRQRQRQRGRRRERRRAQVIFELEELGVRCAQTFEQADGSTRAFGEWVRECCMELVHHHHYIAEAACGRKSKTRRLLDSMATEQHGMNVDLHVLIRLKRQMHVAVERARTKLAHEPVRPAGLEETAERLRRVFARYDRDGSGMIDGDELYPLLRDLGHLCTRDEVPPRPLPAPALAGAAVSSCGAFR